MATRCLDLNTNPNGYEVAQGALTNDLCTGGVQGCALY